MQINKASPRDECQQWTNAADRLQMEHLNFPVLCLVCTCYIYLSVCLRHFTIYIGLLQLMLSIRQFS